MVALFMLAQSTNLSQDSPFVLWGLAGADDSTTVTARWPRIAW